MITEIQVFVGCPKGFAVLPHVETSGAMTVMVRNPSSLVTSMFQAKSQWILVTCQKKTITQALISSATTIVLKIKSPIYRPKQRPMTAGPGASEPPRRS